jgi:ribosomal protein L24E
MTRWCKPFVLGTLVVFAHTACDRSDARLQRAIADLATAEDGQLVEIAVLTDFEWTTLHYFPAYTPDEIIEQDLGFSWPSVETNCGIDSQDGTGLLVFKEDTVVVRYFCQNSCMGGFSEAYRPDGWTPETAVFEIRKLKYMGCFELVPAFGTDETV